MGTGQVLCGAKIGNLFGITWRNQESIFSFSYPFAFVIGSQKSGGALLVFLGFSKGQFFLGADLAFFAAKKLGFFLSPPATKSHSPETISFRNSEAIKIYIFP